MFSVKIISFFSAAHRLRNYYGKCEKLHGHNWKVEVEVETKNLKNGLVIDFHLLKKILEKILEKLDHKYLNELDYFKKINPTSEEISHFIFLELEKKIIKKSLKLKKVSVWESENSCASFSGLNK